MTAVLAGSLYATLHAAFRARRSATAAVAEARTAVLAVELIRADLESAVVPRGILAGGFVGEDAVNGLGRASDALLLHRTAGGAQDTQGAGDIRTVELACEPATDGEGMALLRRVTVNLLTTQAAEPAEEVLCRGVRSLNVRYFDGADWQDAWDSGAQDNALPLAVEVTLELIGEDGARAGPGGSWVCRVFQVPCSAMTAGRQVEGTAG